MYVLHDASPFLLTSVFRSFLTPRQDLWGCVFGLQTFPILLMRRTSHVTLRPFSPLGRNREINHREVFQALSAFWKAAGTGAHARWASFPSLGVSVGQSGSKRFTLSLPQSFSHSAQSAKHSAVLLSYYISKWGKSQSTGSLMKNKIK